ncbi:MAG: hypothetical protein IPN79_18590 [Saprospiraceae bacterium]|nr:hypothetical protein [Saprospiraceae bacterium]
MISSLWLSFQAIRIPSSLGSTCDNKGLAGAILSGLLRMAILLLAEMLYLLSTAQM